MATTKYRRDSEEEALFRSYPYALYFVHSPSTVSHANSGELRNNNESAFHSPLRSETSMNNPITSTGQEATQFALSRYSSRGSNNSFLHEKKMVYDLQSHGNGTENGDTRPVFAKEEIGEDEEDEDEEAEEELFGRKGVWLRYFSFGYSSSFAWMFLQISWRFMVSFGVALLVFYLATKPPPPKMSIKIKEWSSSWNGCATEYVRNV
ncbi:unnamed protein product [Ilex paraguariensis]|uniref:Uncharacterized protein n=1 Tax=Ilex paraguariensis TaxID=185542 RepID=A0ABC8R6G9_9AQUA